MAKKLYVKNLPYGATEDDLADFFSQAGVVKYTKVLRERETNRSKGCGFVELSTDAEFEKALLLNGYELMGRKLFLEEARPLGDKPRTAPRAPVQYQEYAQPEMTMHGWGNIPDNRQNRRRDDKRRYDRFDS